MTPNNNGPSSNSSATIVTSGLSKAFDGLRAVDDLSLKVERGSIFGLLGPNGAGKTTTIAMLLGLLPPTSGSAQVLGFDVVEQGHNVRQRTGALLEDDGLYEQLTARENLDFYARIWGVNDRPLREMELLDAMGLWERKDERVADWSTGMKRRLAIARSLIHYPEVLFLDEPTAGLDVMAAKNVREDLASLSAGEGTTIFLTTHNMVEAERLCDQVAVIRHGRLVAVGNPDELRAGSGLRLEIKGSGFTQETISALASWQYISGVTAEDDRLVIDLEEPMDATPIVGHLIDSGAHVQGVTTDAASLEDVFITLMDEEAP